jgi:hypothetical protein
VFPPFFFVVSYFSSKLRLFDVFGITTVQMPAVSDSGKDGFTFKHWLRESLRVKVALPRKAFGISILDNERLAHSTIGAADSSLRVVHFDAPNMPATVTYRFVLFHRITVSALY